MSTLSDKILSYVPEQYYIFGANGYPAGSATQPTIGSPLGTGGTGTWTWRSATVGTSVKDVVNGGPDGMGAWETWYLQNNITQPPDFRVTSGLPVTPEISDRDFSIGFWLKFTNPIDTPDGTGTTEIAQLASFNVNSINTTLRIGLGGSTSINRGKLTSSIQTGVYSTNRIDDGSWHFIVFRGKEIATNTYTRELYLDGVLFHTSTQTVSWSSVNSYNFSSNNSAIAKSGTLVSIQWAHFFVTPFDTVNSTAISEIYSVGMSGSVINKNIQETPATVSALMVDATIFTSTDVSVGTISQLANLLIVEPTIITQTNKNIQETPATASALMIEPTIVIVANDYTEVTTSISVSAELLTNISISTSQNLNYTVSVPGNATATIGDNVLVTAGSNASISALEMTASALITQPRLAEVPMTASSTFLNAAYSVTPNYRRLVKPLNPSLYLADPYVVDPNQSFVPTFYNDGIDNWGSAFIDSGIRNNFGPIPMSAVGNGNSFSFFPTVNVSTRQFGYSDANAIATANYFINHDNNFTIEFWVLLKENLALNESINIYTLNRSAVDIKNVSGNYRITFTMSGDDIPNDGFGQTWEHRSNFTLTTNSWNHFVITGTYSNVPSGDSNLVTQILHNGQILGATYIKPVGDLPGYKVDPATTTTNGITFNNGGSTKHYLNHIAFYKSVLTNSQIIEHLDFITTASPNKIIYDDAREVSAESGDHSFVVTSNAYYDADPITASGLIDQPTIIAGVSKNVSVSPCTASALSVLPSLKLDNTIYEIPATAYGEMSNPYVLSNLYYQYVQANIAPYRYVSFDASNPYLDFGTDADYAVAATTVGGTIVNPDEAINGKSAKTAGVSYINDGVILKESEHNDNWGTYNASWHSTFWFERAAEDTSTGLKVLWNLNGHNDNQNIILYHYQNKLHLQINNQADASITITSANNVNIFDFDRHFVTIYFHHNNNNNHFYVYVDSVLVLDQNVAAYQVTTINNPIHVGANDEANNFGRLAIGCLITPFAYTALPVVPTNTIIYADEIYWSKTSINQTMVNNLFNIMPDQNNNNSAADPMLADIQSVNPSVSTEVIFIAIPMTANIQLVNPVILAVFNTTLSVLPMEASALLMPGEVFEDRELFPDVMIASAIFNDAGIIIAIPADVMTASVTFPRGISFSDGVNVMLLDNMYTSYIRYLRSDSLSRHSRVLLYNSEVN